MIAFISVLPETTYSSDDVRRLPPDVRECYFADEYKLNYFQRYSYINCLAECRAEIIFKLCNCLPYYLPNNGSMRTCELSEITCVLRHRHVFTGALPGLNRTIFLASEVNFTNTRPCNCLPDCELNQFPTEMTAATLNRTYSYSQISF